MAREIMPEVQARIARGEVEARAMLHALEQAMVRCGYVRDGVYNSHIVRFSGQHGRGTVLLWRSGRIWLGRGFRESQKGPREANPPLPVDKMLADDLVRVADHLAPFLDALEGHSRHLAADLERAVETVRGFLERIQADPRPSDSPAQMSEG